MIQESIKNNIIAISLSYEKANADIRGKFAFFPILIKEFTDKIKNENLGKCFVVSTCNRTEIYSIINKERIPQLLKIYCETVNAKYDQFENYIEIFTGKKAINHIFRVSSGLESQILGDFEIIGQLKTWFKKFKKHDSTDTILEKLLTTAIQISKKIKSETGLSNGAASVSYAAVNYILKNTINPSEKKILLLGIGKIGQNTCINLIKHTETPDITLINRTSEKAEKLANKLHINHKNYSELEKIIKDTDILIVSTSSPFTIIKKNMINPDKPLLIIDLSVPANVSDDVNSLPLVTLLNVDQLSKMIDENLEMRKKHIPSAEAIIDDLEKEFINWTEKRKYAPLIQSFKEDLIKINKKNYANLKKINPSLNGKESELSEKLIQKITDRFANYIINNPKKANIAADIIKEMFYLEWKESFE